MSVRLGGGGSGGGEAPSEKESFSAKIVATAATIASGSFTKVPFDSQEWDTYSDAFNPSNGRFTPPAGKHRVTACVSFEENFADNKQCIVRLYKNGAHYRQLQTFPTNNANMNETGQPGSALVDADGDDYFEVYVFQNQGTAMTLADNPALCYFQGNAL